jgi:hypothetical protein
MAYSASNLYYNGDNYPGIANYTYKSDTDLQVTVIAAGYFNNTDDDLNLTVDDVIDVIGDQGNYRISVVSLSSGAVTTKVVTGNDTAIGAGATLTVSKAIHDGRTIYLDTAAGSVLTIPAATGSGMKLRVVVSVGVTSNTHNILCTGDDTYAGHIFQTDVDSSDALVSYPAIAADTFDDISMNGTTTGGLIGDWFELEDVITDTWVVKGFTNANGTVATPWATT